MPGFSYGGGVGDGTNWSSESGSTPEPGGGNNGNAGNHDTGGSGNSGSSSGNWAGAGPVSLPLINAAITEAIRNGLPRGTVAATSTQSYLVMRAAFDALPASQQPAARDQINQAWQRAHDSMSDKVTTSRESGGSNGYTIYTTSANAAKATQAQAVMQVTNDIQNALNQHQATAAAAEAAAAEAKRKSDEEALRQQAEWDAQHVEEAAQRQVNEAQQSINQATQNKAAAEQQASAHDATANSYESQKNAFRQEQDSAYADFSRLAAMGAMNQIGSPQYRLAVAQMNKSNAAKANADAKQNDINQEHNAAAQARNEANQFQQQIQQFQEEKTAAQNRLNAIQQENEAKARAEADARAAADNKAKAEAAARAKAEAEAAAAAAAQIQAMQLREAAVARLNSPTIQSVRGIPVSASMVGAPLSWAVAGGGGITLGDDIAVGLRAFIRAAVVELNAIATTSLIGPMAIAVGTLFYSKEAGAGSDQVPGRDISALIPGDTFSLPDITTLEQAAETNTPVSMPVRGRMVLWEDGSLETQLVRTESTGSVQVVRASLDPITGYWGYTLSAISGESPQTILVSPADAPGLNGPQELAGPVPLPERIMHTGGQVTAPQGVTLTVTPVADDLDFADVILIFPADSGLKPLYVMLRSPRNMPGTAGGNGQPVGDHWLGDAGVGNGAPFPSQIADKLRGKTFGSFDSFRRAVWKAVADDPELSKQFDPNSLNTMRNGRSPFVSEKEIVGGREKYEIHHVQPISKNGAVYDVDNLRVMTPKRHIEIHKGN